MSEDKRARYERIYREQAEGYDRLVAAEDCDDRLLPALGAIRPLAGLDVAEVGVGTGRVSRLLARGGVGSLVGVEPAAPMLAIARRRMAAEGASLRWRFELGEAAALPIGDASVDLAVAGWVLGHFRGWFPADWEERVDAALGEMRRVLRPGGLLVVIETLGTGAAEPAPPTPELAEYVARLEGRWGLRRTEVPTDYRFGSVDEAAAVCGAFFGEAFAARVRAEGWARVPEWTGIWSGTGA